MVNYIIKSHIFFRDCSLELVIKKRRKEIILHRSNFQSLENNINIVLDLERIFSSVSAERWMKTNYMTREHKLYSVVLIQELYAMHKEWVMGRNRENIPKDQPYFVKIILLVSLEKKDFGSRCRAILSNY